MQSGRVIGLTATAKFTLQHCLSLTLLARWTGGPSQHTATAFASQRKVRKISQAFRLRGLKTLPRMLTFFPSVNVFFCVLEVEFATRPAIGKSLGPARCPGQG
jgi:hypothetical protein